MCATGTPASPDASVPARVEFVSPKTSVQSGRSRSIASRDPRPHRLGVGGVEVEPVARLRQPELLVEDVGEVGVPVLPGVEADLLDPRRRERGRERAGLDELRPVADDGEDFHAGDVTMPRFVGPLAQLVEQGTLNPKVEGSNPSRPIFPRRSADQRTRVSSKLEILSSSRATEGRVRCEASTPASVAVPAACALNCPCTYRRRRLGIEPDRLAPPR